MRPKLLVLTSTYPRWPGDHEPRFVHELSRRLTPAFEVHVLAPHTPGAKRFELMDDVHVRRFRYAPEKMENLAYSGGILARIQECRWRTLLVPIFLLAQALTIRRLVKQHRFSVIHAHWIIPQGVAAIAALIGLRNPPPVVCTSHGSDLLRLRGKLAQTIKAWALKKCASVTVVSAVMADEAKRTAPNIPIAVMPMGTDLETLFVPDSGHVRRNGQLLFVGRLVKKKGLPTLLDAFAMLHSRIGSLELLIVGSGPEEESLRQRCTDLGISESVKFLGSADHEALPALYQQSSVTVVPSIQEGFGLVVVEAIGCGCPVVASDLPPIRNLASHGEGILLVPPGEPAALAAAIESVLGEPAKHLLSASAHREKLDSEFGWTNTARGYSRLLLQAAELPVPPRY